MAILQCNKCANLFHDDAPHECGVERWQRLAHEGQKYFGRAIGNAPKPATPEQPEWKIAPVPQALLDLAEMERKARQEVCGITDLMRGVSPPADRALEDFTARRKAKREQNCSGREIGRQNEGHAGFETSVHEPEVTPAPSRDAPSVIVDAAATLSRAMSTPLPHDPPMSARLMPWRGKE